MTTITALQLTSEIVRLEKLNNRTKTHLQLQKLAYFCHGWFLAIHEDPLVNEEFEAWRFGPVLPSAYYTLKVFSSNNIPADHPFIRDSAPKSLDKKKSEVIDKVLSIYGELSGKDLVEMSHDKDGPWAKIWDKDNASSVIKNAEIKKYFQKIASH